MIRCWCDSNPLTSRAGDLLDYRLVPTNNTGWMATFRVSRSSTTQCDTARAAERNGHPPGRSPRPQCDRTPVLRPNRWRAHSLSPTGHRGPERLNASRALTPGTTPARGNGRRQSHVPWDGDAHTRPSVHFAPRNMVPASTFQLVIVASCRSASTKTVPWALTPIKLAR